LVPVLTFHNRPLFMFHFFKFLPPPLSTLYKVPVITVPSDRRFHALQMAPRTSLSFLCVITCPCHTSIVYTAQVGPAVKLVFQRWSFRISDGAACCFP
jgi:hypothetical protein